MLILLFIALSPLAVNAEILTFQGQETWSTWRAPIGLTQVGDEGQLQLTKFRRNINAVADAHGRVEPVVAVGRLPRLGRVEQAHGRHVAHERGQQG